MPHLEAIMLVMWFSAFRLNVLYNINTYYNTRWRRDDNNIIYYNNYFTIVYY